MREKAYWICFAVVAIASGFQLVSTAFYLAGKSFYLRLPVGSLDPFGLLHLVPFLSTFLHYGSLVLVLRRVRLLIKGERSVPPSFNGIPRMLAYVGAASVTLSLIVLLLTIAFNGGSGVPAGLLLIPASICVPWSVFLTEAKDVWPHLKMRLGKGA